MGTRNTLRYRADEGAGMKKDQADQFEQELMQPLARVLRTRISDAAEYTSTISRT
jgi:hypothetical protein